jgi:hypothetical protein
MMKSWKNINKKTYKKKSNKTIEIKFDRKKKSKEDEICKKKKWFQIK